jgi:uncharacterized repeat protein (TIGR01451 family)
MDRARSDQFLRVIVVLREQADPERVVRDSGARFPIQQMRADLVSQLRGLAERSQAPLLAALDQARRGGGVTSYTPFWIFNGVAIEARPEVIRALAARSDVALVRLDRYRQWVEDPTFVETERDEATSPSVEWGIARIRANEVWSSLHVSGTGVVVAGMDSGVDWLHPVLQTNYRGYNPYGVHSHVGNWFDAVNGAVYPVDDNGHGTHTLGSAVGQDGIGVAPGARWIAVKMLNSAGAGYDSWIHAGFQWLLAPGGDPDRAPDVVNCSWGNKNSLVTTFQPDIEALQAAGILPIFSSGNNGPEAGTVGSPASLPGVFSVGASDERDQVALFSSRGPSPWGEIRPHVVAPGVHVLSSLPGGIYGELDGTSMATPHVAGLAALLHAVSPTLSITRTTSIITSTAVPLTSTIPNNDSGWGRVDAFAAVAALAHPGFITGTVTRAGSGVPIPDATVLATPWMGGGGGTTTTDGEGRYTLALAPSTYDLEVSAFGYAPATVFGVPVDADTVAERDVALTPLPSGTLRGQITEVDGGAPVTATVTVSGTPLATTGAAYTFTLPEGPYVVRARQAGYRVVTATAVITAGEVTIVDLALPSAPTLLLVDGGAWSYDSQITYFRQALDDLALAYDEWPIYTLPDDVPEARDLSPYDAVIWSAPQNGVGHIGAHTAVERYLTSGGRLFLTGQDVGLADDNLSFYDYYRELLKAGFVRNTAGVWVLDGTPGELFAGESITITGPGGADNQTRPDVIALLDRDHAAPVLTYRGDGYGGIQAGTCLDYRSVYLSFGFEGINDRIARRGVMGRVLDWLTAPRLRVGLELTPTMQSHIGRPGTLVTHTVRARHLGYAGITDTVELSLDGAVWSSQLSVPSLTLGPCTSDEVVVSVTVPATVPWDARDVATLTAHSTLSPTIFQTATLTSKAPAPVLLVDDDLFYEQRPIYRAALAEAGIPYDEWQTCPAIGTCRDNSPPREILSRYPIVVWWTGFDLFRPVLSNEEATLQDYLEGGGRLFLSSQDFLHYHHPNAFTRHFLGVLDYMESVTTTVVQGVPGDPLAGWLAPVPLDFPYSNHSDGVMPLPGADVCLRSENRDGTAISHRSASHAAVLFSFPFETLPGSMRPRMMASTVGWLSWLGGSTFGVDRDAVSPGEALTFTLAWANDGPTTASVSLSNTLPVRLTPVDGSLSGPAVYDPLHRRITWQGELASGEELKSTYQVTVATDSPVGALISNTLQLELVDQSIRFSRSAPVRVGAPDLSPSTHTFTPDVVRPGRRVTGTLLVRNAGPADALAATAGISLPASATLVTPSLTVVGGGTAEVGSQGIRWSGSLSAGARVTLTYQLSLPWGLEEELFYGVAFLAGDWGGAWERSAWARQAPWRLFLPVVPRNEGL